MTVTGDSSVVESIAVTGSSFTVILQPNSTISVTSADKKTFTYNTVTANPTFQCLSGSSVLTIAVASDKPADTVAVTPNSDTCSSASSSSSSGGGNGPIIGSIGGGGSSTYIPPASPIANVISANLPPVASQPFIPPSFAKVAFGSRISEVKRLQEILNSDSDTLVASSGPGSKGMETVYFGPATKKAIAKFQVKYGVAKPGQAGYGNFGPKTKAKVIEIAKLKNL